MTEPNKLTVLIVDDDDGHATLIQMNLRAGGLDTPIHRLSDGLAAIDYVKLSLKRGESDSLLILLDINMPVVDGFGVLEYLKSADETRKIPIFMLTSTDDSAEIERCYALGCNIFLKKPVNYQSFVQAVRQLGTLISSIELPSVS